MYYAVQHRQTGQVKIGQWEQVADLDNRLWTRPVSEADLSATPTPTLVPVIVDDGRKRLMVDWYGGKRLPPVNALRMILRAKRIDHNFRLSFAWHPEVVKYYDAGGYR